MTPEHPTENEDNGATRPPLDYDADSPNGFLQRFLLALQFFTRIPITGRLADWVGFSPEMLRACAAHFPGVGLVVAVVGAVVYALADWVWGAHGLTPLVPLAAAIASTIATVLLTGGFHEDGLADTADGLGGHVSKARALTIMKDSRIGAYGAMALILTLAMKVLLLALIGSAGTHAIWAALIGGHVLSRFLPLCLVRVLPHVGDEGTSKSKPLADRIDDRVLKIAFIWCLIALAFVLFTQGALFLIAGIVPAVLVFFWMGRVLVRRLGGFTGDCLGAVQQLCELAFYAGAAAILS
jgi:adenosylcobinamide-GDP ribazoletransferase